MQYYEKKVRKHLFFEGNIFFWLDRIDYFANYPYLCTMKTLLDVHTHTIASGHAYSSLQEMTLAAKEKGLEILGITEHGPNIPGTCDPIYFRNLHCVPRQLYGIKLMLGAELNILNTEGDIDLDHWLEGFMIQRIL